MNDTRLIVLLNDIFYFESNKRVLIVHTKNDEYSFYGKLDQVEKELDGKDFIRTHQSYFVNARKIKSVSKDSAELLNGEILPVSKSKASAVKNAYLSLYETEQTVPVTKNAMLQAQEQYELASGRLPAVAPLRK